MGDRSPAALGMGAVHAVLKEVLEEQAEAMALRTVFFPSLAPWRPQRKQGQRAGSQEVCLHVCRDLQHNWAGTTGASPEDGNRWDKSPVCWCCCRKE